MPAPKKWTPDRLERLSALYAVMPLSRAAEVMGVTESAAHAALHDAGIGKPFRAYIEQKPLTLSDEQVAYLAGLIDADGTVTVRRDGLKWKPQVSIANTSLVLMERLTQMVPPPGARVALQRPAQPVNGRPRAAAYSFKIVGLGWLPLFRALERHLVIKREQMTLAIEWTELRLSQPRTEALSPRHHAIVDTIRQLNTTPSLRSIERPSPTFPFTTSAPRAAST